MASEVWEDDMFFDVLSYSFPNDSNSMVCMGSGNKVTATFKLPEGRYIRYVDIILQVAKNDTVPTVTLGVSASATQKTLTMVDLGNNRYRLYGSYSQYSPTICITVTASHLQAVTFDAFRISYQTIDTFDEDGYCDIQAYGYSELIHYVPTDLINYRSFTGASYDDPKTFGLLAYCDNWRKYDFMDFTFTIAVAQINSIDVRLGGKTIVPAEVSYLSSDGIESYYSFSVRIDLRNVNRMSTDRLMINIKGEVIPAGSNFVSVDGIRGYIDAGEVNLLYVFLRNIITELANIKNVLAGDSSSADEFNQAVQEQVGELDQGKQELDKLEKPDLQNAIGNVNVDKGSDGLILVNTVLTGTISSEYLGFIFTLCIVLGIISYLLYGRR